MINEMNFPNKSRVRKASAFLIVGHETFKLCITRYAVKFSLCDSIPDHRCDTGAQFAKHHYHFGGIQLGDLCAPCQRGSFGDQRKIICPGGIHCRTSQFFFPHDYQPGLLKAEQRIHTNLVISLRIGLYYLDKNASLLVDQDAGNWILDTGLVRHSVDFINKRRATRGAGFVWEAVYSINENLVLWTRIFTQYPVRCGFTGSLLVSVFKIIARRMFAGRVAFRNRGYQPARLEDRHHAT